jgi:hypothetical protein
MGFAFPRDDQIPQLIAPHQRVTTYCTYPLDHIRQVRDGHGHAYIIGDIAYKDRLDEGAQHRTQFSFELIDINIFDPPTIPNNNAITPAVFLSFQPRGQHNCADEDCPK